MTLTSGETDHSGDVNIRAPSKSHSEQRPYEFTTKRNERENVPLGRVSSVQAKASLHLYYRFIVIHRHDDLYHEGSHIMTRIEVHRSDLFGSDGLHIQLYVDLTISPTLDVFKEHCTRIPWTLLPQYELWAPQLLRTIHSLDWDDWEARFTRSTPYALIVQEATAPWCSHRVDPRS